LVGGLSLKKPINHLDINIVVNGISVNVSVEQLEKLNIIHSNRVDQRVAVASVKTLIQKEKTIIDINTVMLEKTKELKNGELGTL